jgi:hypothetical protein
LGPRFDSGHPVLEGHGLGEGRPRRLVLEQPVGNQVRVLAVEGRFERVKEMAVPAFGGGAHPVDEADALLEGGRGLANEAVLVDAEKLEGGPDRREGALADADDADLRGFEQGDREVAVGRQVEGFGEIGGGQPARRSAADDQNVALASHAALLA